MDRSTNVKRSVHRATDTNVLALVLLTSARPIAVDFRTGLLTGRCVLARVQIPYH